MTISTKYQEEIQKRNINVWSWVEISGLPYAYGNFSGSSDLFSSRAADEKFLGVKPFIAEPIKGYNQSIDVLEGTSTIGTVELTILNNDDTLMNDLGLTSGKSIDGMMLRSGMTSTTGSIVVINDAATISSVPQAGVLHVGRETIAYTSHVEQSFVDAPTSGVEFRGLTRGAYNSDAADYPAGMLVTTTPVHLAQRIARVNYFVSSSAPSASVEVEADSVLRSICIVTDASLNKEGTGFKLKLDSIDKRISGFVDKKKQNSNKIFTRRFKSKLSKGICMRVPTGGAESRQIPSDADPDDYTQDDDGQYNDTKMMVIRSSVTNHAFISGYVDQSNASTLAQYNSVRGRGYTFFVKVDEEIFCVQFILGIPYLTILMRGCFGTERINHERDADVEEVMILAGDINGTAVTDSADLPYYFLPQMKDDPLSLALSILTSTGHGTNGNYDVLPGDWSCAVPQEYIDVTEIEQTRNAELGGISLAGVIDEEIVARDFLRDELFKPFLCFPLMKLGGLYTIRRITTYIDGDDVEEIGPSELIDSPSWDANLTSTIGRVIYRYNKQLDGSMKEHKIIMPYVDQMYDGVFGGIERDSSLLRDMETDHPDGRLVFRKLIGSSAPSWVEDEAGWWQFHFERPAPIVNVNVTWKNHLIEPGDNIILSSDSLPNATTGVVGVTSGSFTVISKKLDDTRGTVGLQMFHNVISTSQFRRISPSAVVSSYVGGTFTVTVKTGADDCAISGEKDTDHFQANDVVVVCTPDLSSVSTPIVISSVNTTAGTITFPSGPSVTPAAGYVIMFAMYDDAILTQKSRYAYLADPARLLGGDDDVTHLYVP